MDVHEGSIPPVVKEIEEFVVGLEDELKMNERTVEEYDRLAGDAHVEKPGKFQMRGWEHEAVRRTSSLTGCVEQSDIWEEIYFILFYFILFYFILFYFILFYFILFYFILFYFILFYFILFYFILFY